MSPGRRRIFSREVLQLEYSHVDDPDDVVRVHEFDEGVCMYAMPDGSVLLKRTDGRSVWADMDYGPDELEDELEDEELEDELED